MEQKLAQALAEFFHTEISFNDPAVTNRNLAGFLGHNEHDGIRLLAQAQTRSVAQAEVAIEVFALGEGKNAGGGHDAVAADDNATIVQNRLGVKDGQGEFF